MKITVKPQKQLSPLNELGDCRFGIIEEVSQKLWEDYAWEEGDIVYRIELEYVTYINIIKNDAIVQDISEKDHLFTETTVQWIEPEEFIFKSI